MHKPIDLIPLSSAFLCPDCQIIGGNSRACACCGSYALISLATVLDGRKDDAYEEERVLYRLEMDRPIST